MMDYGVVRVLGYYVNGNGQTKVRILEVKHYITLEEARKYAEKVRENNPKIVSRIMWMLDPVNL